MHVSGMRVLLTCTAIERAMAYIDTGELPWDMDLFDQNSEVSSYDLDTVKYDPSQSPFLPFPLQHPNGPPASEATTSDEDNPVDEALAAEAKKFESQLQQFHEARGTPILRQPAVGPHDLNLFQLYRLVKANGGMDRVTTEMKWRSLYLQLGLPSIPSPSPALRQAYRK